jgi:hypothetical protein
MWAALLEKAWAKMKGNYLIAEGGLVENGLHYLVGIPVIRYYTSQITSTAEAEAMWDIFVAADAANYLMGAGTAGSGDDSQTNSCGIAMSHAYSILAAFEMTDASGTVHKCLLIRNPWGVAYYTGNWHKTDTRWTDALAAQVPLGIDPRTDQASQGVFVVSTAEMIGSDCFADF